MKKEDRIKNNKKCIDELLKIVKSQCYLAIDQGREQSYPHLQILKVVTDLMVFSSELQSEDNLSQGEMWQ